MRFRFLLHNPVVVEDAANRLRSVDAMMIPHGILVDLPYADLWRDTWVAIVAEENPDIGDAVSTEQLQTMPWVLNYQARSAFTSAERQIQQIGIEPNVDVVVESFLALPPLRGRHRTASASSRARSPRPSIGAGSVCGPSGCRSTPTPLVNALWWHPCTATIRNTCGCASLFVEVAFLRSSEAPL